MDNIVKAVFGAQKQTTTRRLWKIDQGMKLQFVGLTLPAAYQVHFCNTPNVGQAKTVVATSDTVDIPDEYLQSGEDVYAWIYLTPENGVGYTVYMVTIPVYARPDVTDEEPTPEQQSAIDQAIAALNEAVDGVGESIDAALEEAKESGEFDGEGGLSLALSVPVYTLPCTRTMAIPGSMVSTQVIARKGSEGVSVTIDAGSLPSISGLTITASGSTLTVRVTGTGYNMSRGIFVPVIVDGKSYQLAFTLIVALSGGIETWTSSAAPTTDPGGSRKFFLVADLTGAANDEPKSGDIILYGDYRYTTTGNASWGRVFVDDGYSYKGADGDPGMDGVSPVASVIQTETGATVTVTDASGTTSAELTNGVDGVSPTASVTQTSGGAVVTVTDGSGTTTATLTNGATGATGPQGEQGLPGADGFSPTAAVSKSGSTATITITDKNGTTTATVSDGAAGQNGQDGADGQDGVSPVVSVTDITGGHRVVITDATGAHSFDVMDGDAADAPVQDVQVDGTSVLADGVANIPIASSSVPGVVMAGGGGGIGISDGTLGVIPSSASAIKGGADFGSVIVPARQEQSVFYGLAKSAGDATQSASSNAVGTYTNDAKIAIQKMLGIYQPPWELLNDITLNAEGGISLTADSNGTPYNILQAYVLITYSANLQTASAGYSRFMFYDENDEYVIAETGKYSTNANTTQKSIFVVRNGNMVFMPYTRLATTGGFGDLLYKTVGGLSFTFGNIVKIETRSGDVEPAGTRIQIYGQRAY